MEKDKPHGINSKDITGQKKTEITPKVSGKNFENIFNATSDGMLIVDKETNKFTMWNKACCNMLGYSPEEFSNLNIADIHPQEELPFIFEQIGVFFRGDKNIRSDIKFRRKDGTVIIADLNPSMITLNQKDFILLSFRDITKRKQTEEALLISERQYRMLIEHASDGIFITDQKGKVIDVNKRGCAGLGYTREEILNRNATDFINTDTNNSSLQPQELLNGKTLLSERIATRKDGSIFPVEISATLLEDGRLLAIVRDITEKKKLEEEIRYNSYHDKLTDLYNRRYLDEELDRLQNSRHYPISIFSLDLDGLKIINDTLGHAVGDKYIQKAAEVLIDTFPRKEDFKCRMGGDEFIIIVSETEQETLQKLTEKLKFNLQNAQIEASVGVATASNWKESLRDISRDADNKMYADKKAKKAILNPTKKD